MDLTGEALAKNAEEIEPLLSKEARMKLADLAERSVQINVELSQIQQTEAARLAMTSSETEQIAMSIGAYHVWLSLKTAMELASVPAGKGH